MATMSGMMVMGAALRVWFGRGWGRGVVSTEMLERKGGGKGGKWQEREGEWDGGKGRDGKGKGCGLRAVCGVLLLLGAPVKALHPEQHAVCTLCCRSAPEAVRSEHSGVDRRHCPGRRLSLGWQGVIT